MQKGLCGLLQYVATTLVLQLQHCSTAAAIQQEEGVAVRALAGSLQPFRWQCTGAVQHFRRQGCLRHLPRACGRNLAGKAINPAGPPARLLAALSNAHCRLQAASPLLQVQLQDVAPHRREPLHLQQLLHLRASGKQ
jgi:hypothetical protein